MDHFLYTGCLSHLDVAYSRYTCDLPDVPTQATPTTPATHAEHLGCYVQDVMAAKWEELGSWIVKDRAAVYVCG